MAEGEYTTYVFTKRQAWAVIGIVCAGLLLLVAGVGYGTFLFLRHNAQHAAAEQFQRNQQQFNQEIVSVVNGLIQQRK